jgi:hypothetical protein
MAGKMNVNVSGGSVSIGQVIQGETVSVSGNVAVDQTSAALRGFRDEALAAAGDRGLADPERAALEKRIGELEAAIRAAKANDRTALKRLRAAVEDFRGAFGWTAPLLKGVLAVCLPGVAALIK